VVTRVPGFADSWRLRLGRNGRTAGLTLTLQSAALLVAYVVAAKLGLKLSVAHGLITPVWAPTGIALAGLVLFGRRLWPVVALAAFIANATSGASIVVAALIAVGNTLEALVGSELLRRVRFRPALDRVQDVLALIFLGAVFSTAVSATNGVTTLWIAGDLSGSHYGSSWLLWWIGDGMGDLVVASMLFVWATTPRKLLARTERRVEAFVLFALLTSLSSLVFLGGYWRYPHVLFPLLIWATLRFRQLGATASSFVVTAIAIAGAVSGNTPLGDGGATEIVQILEGLLAGVTVSVLILGAVLSERAQADERLERAHAGLAEAQEVAHVGSWEWEIGPNRVGWSDELYRLYGLEPGSVTVTYESFLERVHPDDRAEVRSAVERTYSRRGPFELDHRVLLPDGQIRWLHARGRMVDEDSGAPPRMVGTSQDVTERRRLDELRDNILSSVSHELRTPLTSILGFAVTLRERGATLGDELRAEILATLSQQAYKLERLLSDLLDLERLRHGFVHPTFSEVDVARLVAEVAADHADGTHRITMRTVPAPAEVDPPKLERIVENLLTNARRHTPPGTEIIVSVERRNGGVVIGVDDHGPGVAADEREAIFEIFRRGAEANSQGVGIGLSLVAQFTALHNGTVWVEDSPSGGASFRVFLPATQV
jgi:PAS domain S-box-containing protein